MLSAAPNEFLDFTVVTQDISMNEPVPTPLRMDSLSNKKRSNSKSECGNYERDIKIESAESAS